MRNTVLRMLIACHLVSDERQITPLHPTQAFLAALDAGHQDDLQVFPGGVR